MIENALEFQLTGHDDYGSGTTLATTLANITASRQLFALLHPLLVPRYPGLPAVYARTKPPCKGGCPRCRSTAGIGRHPAGSAAGDRGRLVQHHRGQQGRADRALPDRNRSCPSPDRGLHAGAGPDRRAAVAPAQFRAANAVTFVIYGALGGFAFVFIPALEIIAGYSPVVAGSALVPVTAVTLLLSGTSGRLAQRIGPRLPVG